MICLFFLSFLSRFINFINFIIGLILFFGYLSIVCPLSHWFLFWSFIPSNCIILRFHFFLLNLIPWSQAESTSLELFPFIPLNFPKYWLADPINLVKWFHFYPVKNTFYSNIILNFLTCRLFRIVSPPYILDFSIDLCVICF